MSLIGHIRRIAGAGCCHVCERRHGGSIASRLRREGSKLILGEKRPRAFAFLSHDRGPILGCRIEGVDIHELAAVRGIKGEIEGMSGFIESAVTDYFRGAPAKNIEPM